MTTHRCLHRVPLTARCPAAAALLLGTCLLGTGLLAGCSTNVGDLPYPAVHDMPPPRADSTLSDAERQKAAQDLVTTRDSIESRAQQNAQSYAQEGNQEGSQTGSTGTKSAAAGKPGGQ